MIKSKKKTVSGKKHDSEFRLLFYNLSVQVIVFILITFISFVAGIKTEMYYYISIAGLCVGNIITGFLSGRVKKQKGLFYGALYSVIFNILVIILSLIFNSFSADYTLILSFIIPLIFSCVGGVIAVNLKRKAIKH